MDVKNRFTDRVDQGKVSVRSGQGQDLGQGPWSGVSTAVVTASISATSFLAEARSSAIPSSFNLH